MLPLSLKAMPPEGTLEFWFAPDDDPRHTCQYLTVLAGQQEVMWLDTHNTIRVRCRTTGARTPLPYNKIGAIPERRGDDKGALKMYTKSLEVEWNQPSVIEAKSRLTLRLKQ